MTVLSNCVIEILGPDVAPDLHLERGVIREYLGAPFEMSLSLVSDDPELDLTKALGSPLTIRLTMSDPGSGGSGERFFHGLVSQFAFVGTSTHASGKIHGHYQATVRPNIWFASQSIRSRVFRDSSVQDVVQAICGEYEQDVMWKASPDIRFEHCVQYRESDLNFISRLMERHGAYYYFDHAKEAHEMKVISGLDGHQSVGSFACAAGTGVAETDQITDWRAASHIQFAAYGVTGTEHLTRNKVEAQARSRFKATRPGAMEMHDFEMTTERPEAHLSVVAKVRMEEADAQVEEFSGSSRTLALRAGGLFDLTDHPRGDQNREYLVVSATYHLEGPPIASNATTTDTPFQVHFTAIDSETPFRPQRRARKPVALGPHTAVVVEETDDYGRVKVRFHWGDKDGDLESCFARVSQNWAGNQWGGVFLPHLDHEVLVEFLDGDPDQPVITGRVYNKESMPPLSLPGAKSQSIIRDHGGNEILLEGKEGGQKIRLWCPTHETEMVMGNSVELTSLSDFKNVFQGNWKQVFQGSHDQQIAGNQDVTIGGAVAQTVAGKFNLKIGGDLLSHQAGFEVKVLVGYFSTMMLARKVEVIKGSSRARVHGMKFEKVTGDNIAEGTQAREETWKNYKQTVKEKREEACKQRIEKVKDFYERNWNKVKTTAKDKKDKLDNWSTEATKNMKQKAKAMSTKVTDKLSVAAKKIEEKASSAINWVASKISGNNGDFTMKK